MPHQLPSRSVRIRPSLLDRRRTVRRAPADGVAGQLLGDGEPVGVAVINLSEGGACLALGRCLARGAALTLRLLHHDRPAALTAEARVVWCEQESAGVYHVGCRFTSALSAADLLPFIGP